MSSYSLSNNIIYTCTRLCISWQGVSRVALATISTMEVDAYVLTASIVCFTFVDIWKINVIRWSVLSIAINRLVAITMIWQVLPIYNVIIILCWHVLSDVMLVYCILYIIALKVTYFCQLCVHIAWNHGWNLILASQCHYIVNIYLISDALVDYS